MTLNLIDIQLISENNQGISGNNSSYSPVFSPDGTKIAFSSLASNLVFDDTNEDNDAFIKDLTTGIVTRVSTSASNEQIGGYFQAFLSDGNRVIFMTKIAESGEYKPLIRNLLTGEVTEISPIDHTIFGLVFSPDENKVVFYNKGTNSTVDIFIADLITGSVAEVSTSSDGVSSNNSSYGAVFSPDGKFIAFTSSASNLVAQDKNPRDDIFIKDLTTGHISLLATNSNGVQANGSTFELIFTPDGRRVIFRSQATNLVNEDTNGAIDDIFIKDLITGKVEIVSANNMGIQGNSVSFNPVLSPDGTKVAFIRACGQLI
jgi:Tol biopolymer transport system component